MIPNSTMMNISGPLILMEIAMKSQVFDIDFTLFKP